MEENMKKHLSTFNLFLFLLILAGCTKNNVGPDIQPVRELTTSEIKLTEADNLFGLKLFKEIVSTEPDKNIFISPLSVSMALGMTYNGANNETRTAMHQTLEYGELNQEDINSSYQSLIQLLQNLDPKVQFNIANSIWYREGFSVLPDFLTLNQTYFDAVVQALNFSDNAAVTTINNWVSSKTNSKIKKIVDEPIDANTVMFLINAIYFKGTWTYEFDKAYTTSQNFYQDPLAPVQCKLMTHTATHRYFSNEQMQAIDLTYGDEKFSMTVLLPNADADIDEFIAQMDNETWNTWMQEFSPTEVALYLPKFRIEYGIEMNYVLSALGMEIAFDPGLADFSNINPDEQLFINKVKHKTFVDVDEEGTEAAAVTSVEIALTAMPDSPVVMRIDRPFVFVIRESHSGTILFIGKIVEPKVA